MQLIINGEPREIDDGLTLATYLEQLGLKPQMIVAERNGEIVPRHNYVHVSLQEQDTLELVQMMAGG